MKTKKTIKTEIKIAKLNGLDEMPVLFYGTAKNNGIIEGDTIEVVNAEGTTSFEVGSYHKFDKFNRKISSFVLIEKS